jgi:hypothetical protein
MLTSDISDKRTTLQLLKIVKSRKRVKTVVELDDEARRRLSELENIITSQLGSGAFFLVAISLKEIDEKCLYGM